MINPKVGERVRYRIPGNEFYDGTILKINDNDVQIHWDDGTNSRWLHRYALVRLKSKRRPTKQEWREWCKNNWIIGPPTEPKWFENSCVFLRLKDDVSGEGRK